MRFEEHRASDYRVDAVWVYRRCVAMPDALPHYVPPDGSVDIIVRWSGRRRPRVLVHGPSLRFHLADIPAEDRLVGVRFKPGVAGPLLRLSEKTRRDFALALPTDGTALANIEQRVLELVDQTGTSPALVAEFVAAVDEARGGRRVGRILEQVRAHERALQRSATKWIAMTPKSFVRVVRIRAAERGIRNGESLADLAADLGFADQAHLTRDFGEQMGTSPAKWRLSDFFKTQALARPISMENPTEPNHE